MPTLRRLVPLLALLVACDAGTSGAPAPGGIGAGTGAPEVSALIDAAQGGLVADPDGASVSVPAGAVPKEVRISLRSVPPPQGPADGARVVGKVWSFKVDGADRFQFAKAVRVAVPYDPSQASSDAPVGLSVWRDGRWQDVPGARAEPDARRVTAEVDHFSDYAPTQPPGPAWKPPGPGPDRKPPGPADARPGPFESEYYYGTVRVQISGAGNRGGDSPRSFSISRQAEVKFRVQASSGQVAADAAMEQLERQGFKLPPEVQEGLELSRQRRSWITSPTNRAPEDETEHRLSVNDSYDATDPDWGEGGRLGPDTVTHRTLSGGNAGKSATMHQLVIDLGKKTYSFGAVVPAGELELIETVTGQPDKRQKAPAFVRWQFTDRKLPAEGGVLSETLPIPRDHLDRHISQLGSWGGYDFGSLSGSITWTLSPVPFEEVELVLTPQGWDDWLPRGGADEGTKGNSIHMKASLRGRGGGSTKARLKQLVVELDDVSRVPGVCLNRPLQGGATAPDLKFAPGPGLTIEDDGLRLIKKGEHSELSFEVECYDWGAWGEVVAHGTLTDGRPVWATLEGDPSQAAVRLPKRESSSKIADKWKADMGVAGLEDVADDDPQQGNRIPGDGLSLYEEYRGLISKGKHTRDLPAGPDGAKPLTPKKKDLVVHDTIKTSAVQQGFQLLAKAAHIHVVDVRDGELPESRRVNLNTQEDLTAGEQYGLRLIDRATSGGGVGETPGSGPSPKSYSEVIVWLEGCAQNYAGFKRGCAARGEPVPFSANESIAVTVAHELAHGTGVSGHHGPDVSFTAPNPLPDAAKVYDDKGQPATVRSAEGRVAEPRSSSSGDVSCIMCYNNNFDWCYRPGEGYFLVPVVQVKQTRLCTDGKGTGPNAQGLFGDSNNGNCLGRMSVRDR